MTLDLLRFHLWRVANRLRRLPSRGAALRRVTGARLRRAGLEPLVDEEVVVDHAARGVVRGTSPAGDRRYIKLDLRGMRLDREAAALRAAQAAGVPTPPIIAVVPGQLGALVLGELAGQPMRPATGEASWRAAGEVLRRLHAVAAPTELIPASGPAWRERCLAQAEAAWATINAEQLLPSATARRLAAMLDERLADVPADADRFVHGDCQAWHVMVEHGAVTGIIDWADAVPGDPLWDLTVLTRFAPARRPTTVEGYDADAATRARMDDALETYGMLREVQSARWTFEHHQDPTYHLDALRALAGTAPQAR